MKAVLFDTETTGLISNRTLPLSKQPSIIEFYGCFADLEKRKIQHDFSCLIKPPKPIDEEITKITTITNDDLKDMETIEFVGDSIFKYLQDAPILIAHNATFDKEMIELEAERLGRKIKWPKIICTIEQTIAMKGYRLSLNELHQTLFGAPFAGAHRAKVDVQALLKCCVELYKRGIL